MCWHSEPGPATRDAARIFGLVTLEQMIGPLVSVIENPSIGAGFTEVLHIRIARF